MESNSSIFQVHLVWNKIGGLLKLGNLSKFALTQDLQMRTCTNSPVLEGK